MVMLCWGSEARLFIKNTEKPRISHSEIAALGERICETNSEHQHIQKKIRIGLDICKKCI